MAGLAAVAKNTMLDALAAITQMGLHSADPGGSGTSNELTGGSPAYARKTVTWSSASGSPLPLPALLANELKLGTKLELEAHGEFSTTGTPTLQIGFIYGAVASAAGGTTLAASGTITTASGAAAFPWRCRWVGTVTTVGASGVIYGSGILELGTSLIAFAQSSLPITAAARSVAIDTTAAKLLGVGAAWGASSGSNSITVDTFTAKILNQGKT